MSKKKTLKKGGGYYPFDFLERRDNRMSRDGYYLKNPRFNSEVINAYNNKFPDSKIDERENKFICTKCPSAALNIFNLLRVFDVVRKDPNMKLQAILEDIKSNETKMKQKCKENSEFCKDNKIDEEKINLCYHCNKKYIQEIYRELSIDVIPTLYVPDVSSKWLKDIDFENIELENNRANRRSQYNRKTLYLFIRFKDYNSKDGQLGQQDNVYTISLHNTERDKQILTVNGDNADESLDCKYGFITSPCTLKDLLNAHFNNIATIILNSYIAGQKVGGNVNKVFYDKLMYYCDIDENILITNKKSISLEDKNYYENIKTKIREFLNVKKLNQIINDKLKTYYQVPFPNVTIFKKKSIKKPDVFIRLESYKDKMTENEYKNLESIMKKLEENGIFDRQRRLQEKKSKSFHTITINTLNLFQIDVINYQEYLLF